MQRVELFAVPGLPMVKAGDDLARLISERLKGDLALRPGDVLVLAQKIVSKAEGRVVDLKTVTPSVRAIGLAAEVQKDPRLVELILSESVRVVRNRPNVLIVEHRLGLVMANAGIDQSNVAPQDGVERALLLPKDPDASAEALRAKLGATALLIIDSFGRPWRRGLTDVAIGVSGIAAVVDLRDTPDALGRTLMVTEVAIADEISSAAELVMVLLSGVKVRPVSELAPKAEPKTRTQRKPRA
jgi:coenzyme F420-0:L-glutamate ligase/coenzyme F420-1:gamma-L-glutamate ligase